MDKQLRLGLAGLGTVGSSVARLIERNRVELAGKCQRGIEITAVSARDPNKARGADLGSAMWFDDAAEMARSAEIDVLIELIGGADGIAYEAVTAALTSGKHVITANKALIAAHGVELARLAETRGVSLNFEAAVAGGIPIVKTLREALAGNRVSHVYGILNGTCNYILTRMEKEHLSFEACLKRAQELGYAEADPTFDIEGHDTAHKLAILTSLAFGTEISDEDIYMEGISSITTADIEAADDLGYRIKLLGVAQRTESGIEQRVHPAMVPKASAIAQIDGVTNAVAIDGDFVGEIVLAGAGAGGDATASAVVGDIADIARSIRVPALGRPADLLTPYVRARMRAHEGGYYIRLMVQDRPGAFAAIATRMSEKGISLQSIVQKDLAEPTRARDENALKPVILITYDTMEAGVREALELIEADNVIVGPPQLIRIEKLY